MLIHIVVWKYKPETTEEKRAEHRRKLAALKEQIEEIVELNVGADVLHLARSYDTGIVVKFKSLEDLDIYTNKPPHLEVAAMGKEISAHVVSVDFFTD